MDISSILNSAGSIATIAGAIATVVLARLSYKTLNEMKETRISESRPYVVAYLEFDTSNKFIYFICKNIGKTCAYNVVLDFDKPILDFEEKEVKNQLFDNPMPSMPPDYQIRTFINNGPDILNKPKQETDADGRYIVKVNISYSNNNLKYNDTSILDLLGFKNIRYGNSDEYLSRGALQSIAASLSKWSNDKI